MSREPMDAQAFSDHFHNILNELGWLRHLHGDLERENEELREEVRVMREQEVGVASACCERLPRVITADELREGQWVSWKQDGRWHTIPMRNEFDTKDFTGDGGPIVLLEDAPEPEIVTAETIRASEPGTTYTERDGNIWEWTGKSLRHHSECPCPECRKDGLGGEHDVETALADYGPFARSTVAPRGDYGTPPRLTVHRLNVAPVGSTIDGDVVRPLYYKHGDGLWRPSSGPWNRGYSAAFIVEHYGYATLRLPEAA